MARKAGLSDQQTSDTSAQTELACSVSIKLCQEGPTNLLCRKHGLHHGIPAGLAQSALLSPACKGMALCQERGRENTKALNVPGAPTPAAAPTAFQESQVQAGDSECSWVWDIHRTLPLEGQGLYTDTGQWKGDLIPPAWDWAWPLFLAPHLSSDSHPVLPTPPPSLSRQPSPGTQEPHWLHSFKLRWPWWYPLHRVPQELGR